MPTSTAPRASTDSLQQQLMTAQKTAFESMREANEYGEMIQFIRHSFVAANSIEALMDALYDYMHSLNLRCSLQIRSMGLVETWSAKNTQADPVEIEIFEISRFKGRAINFNAWALFNAANISLLIKNMPENPDDYGRKKDLFSILVDLCETKICNLEKHITTQKLMSALTDAITDLSISYKANSNHTIDAMNILMEDMKDAFDVLALTEIQETMFTDLVDHTIGKLVSIHTENKELEDRFMNILSIGKKYFTSNQP